MDLLPVETALERVVAGVSPVGSERLALAAAGGRVLAEPVIARRQQPAFTASAMDGYAFNSADAEPHARLALVGEAAAGQSLPVRSAPRKRCVSSPGRRCRRAPMWCCRRKKRWSKDRSW